MAQEPYWRAQRRHCSSGEKGVFGCTDGAAAAREGSEDGYCVVLVGVMVMAVVLAGDCSSCVGDV